MMKQILIVIVLFFSAQAHLALSDEGKAKAVADATTHEFDEGLPENAVSITRPPFGHNLFSGAYQAEREDGLSSDYRLSPGDRLSLRLWGLLKINEIVAVDAKGNIFIPNIGAVKMSGVRAGDVSSVVRNKIKSVYKTGVEAYVTVLTATPVSVFVTGPVKRPGQYAGIPSDSILSFLHRAGGINAIQGSYRKIKIRRQQQVIREVDLYPFLKDGILPDMRFRDGDTIVVEQQGASVSVEGDTRASYRFELSTREASGSEIANYARPYGKVTHVALSGTRNGRPWSAYLPYKRFLDTRILDGDSVRFVSDARTAVIDVSLEGSYLGNSYFAIKKGSRLKALLDYIEVDPFDADTGNIYIKRKRVALQQKRNIDKALRRLEQSIMTAPARSDGEAAIRAREAELIQRFVKRAMQVRPEGRVVVSERGEVNNIRLEDGDVVVIPPKSDVVMIEGEVQLPQAVVYAQNADALDYIVRAGGFTERADPDRIALMHPNGQVEIGANLYVSPGDQIMVFPKVDTKDIQFAKDLTQIIYQIAIAARAATGF